MKIKKFLLVLGLSMTLLMQGCVHYDTYGDSNHISISEDSDIEAIKILDDVESSDIVSSNESQSEQKPDNSTDTTVDLFHEESVSKEEVSFLDDTSSKENESKKNKDSSINESILTSQVTTENPEIVHNEQLNSEFETPNPIPAPVESNTITIPIYRRGYDNTFFTVNGEHWDNSGNNLNDGCDYSYLHYGLFIMELNHETFTAIEGSELYDYVVNNIELYTIPHSIIVSMYYDTEFDYVISMDSDYTAYDMYGDRVGNTTAEIIDEELANGNFIIENITLIRGTQVYDDYIAKGY